MKNLLDIVEGATIVIPHPFFKGRGMSGEIMEVSDTHFTVEWRHIIKSPSLWTFRIDDYISGHLKVLQVHKKTTKGAE